jgi:hypothetical protein
LARLLWVNYVTLMYLIAFYSRLVYEVI